MWVWADSVTRIAGLLGAVLVLGTGAASGQAGVTGAAGPAVEDRTPPRGAVAGVRSPLREPIEVYLTASDGGGLATAAAILDGVPVAAVALSPSGCEAGGEPPTACATAVSGVALRIDPTGLSIGPHRLQVRVVDAAGNGADVYDGTVAIAGPATPASRSVQVRLGQSGRSTPAPRPPVAAKRRPRCAAPWLSMMLDQRPLRARGGRLGLGSGQRYRFRGRLTCRAERRRVGAPRGTRVEILVRVGGRVVGRGSARTRRGGHLVLALAPRTSCTLLFRYRADRERSQVRIPVTVLRQGPGRR